MNVTKLYNKMVSYFDNRKMYQILLKYNTGIELSLQEKQELDYWVYVHEHRSKLFKHLTLVIELQHELKAVMNVNELNSLLQKIKTSVPVAYFDMTNVNDFNAIHIATAKGLKIYSNEIVLRLIRNHMWGAIIVFLAIVTLVCFVVFMTIRFS